MLADDAWNSSVTSAMSYGGSDNGTDDDVEEEENKDVW